MKEKDHPGVDRWADEPDGMSVVDHSRMRREQQLYEVDKGKQKNECTGFFYYETELATKGTAEECNKAINRIRCIPNPKGGLIDWHFGI